MNTNQTPTQGNIPYWKTPFASQLELRQR